VRAALGQSKPLGYLSQRHIRCAIGQEFDDVQASFCGDVRHGFAMRKVDIGRVGRLDKWRDDFGQCCGAGAKKPMMASI
jgi:hypothetical protein